MTEQSEFRWLKEHWRITNFQRIYLKYAGIWAVEENASSFSKWMHFLHSKITLASFFIFTSTVFADICASIDDISIATDDGCVFAGIFIVTFKAVNHHVHGHEISKLRIDILKCGEELCRCSASDTNDKILKFYAFRDRAAFFFFSVIGYTLVIALIFFVPTGENGLPIRARYPFDTSSSPAYEIVLLLEVYVLCFGMTTIIGIDCLSFTLCSMLTFQAELLNANFRNCKNSECLDGEKQRRDCYAIVPFEEHESEDFARRYTRYVRYQNRLVLLLAEYNKMFSFTMFAQTLSSTSMICLTTFQTVVVVGQRLNVLKFSIYFSAAFTQLFYMCWIGNELISESAELSDSQWLSEWNNRYSCDTVRLVIVSILISQNPWKLKAGKFYVLSMQTFIAIMRGAYSFFTVLRNMYSDD